MALTVLDRGCIVVALVSFLGRCLRSGVPDPSLVGGSFNESILLDSDLTTILEMHIINYVIEKSPFD